MAVGFMRALKQYQLRCPDDLAIVTCDDHPWLDSFTPRPTTVNLPKYELGTEGARVLLDRMTAGDSRRRARGRTIVLKTTLRIRESCGAVAADARQRWRTVAAASRLVASRVSP